MAYIPMPWKYILPMHYGVALILMRPLCLVSPTFLMFYFNLIMHLKNISFENLAVRMGSSNQEIKHVKQVHKLRFSSELSPKC